MSLTETTSKQDLIEFIKNWMDSAGKLMLTNCEYGHLNCSNNPSGLCYDHACIILNEED